APRRGRTLRTRSLLVCSRAANNGNGTIPCIDPSLGRMHAIGPRMTRTNKLTAAVLLASASAFAVTALAQERVPDYADVTYAVVGEHTLTLDIYLPDGDVEAPLVVWVHGGAWQFGTKAGPPSNFAESGFAL